MPDWVAFEKMVASLRKKYGVSETAPKRISKVADKVSTGQPILTIDIPKNLPGQFIPVVESVRQSVMADLPKILDFTLPVRKLFDQTPAFMGRYFWVEDGLSEVDDYERSASLAWNKAMSGHSDDSSLLTLLLCVATSSTPKAMLTEKGATTLIHKARKNGIEADLASQYIEAHAPAQHQEDYARLWLDFMAEAQATLESDHDYALKDALSLLRRECNVKAA